MDEAERERGLCRGGQGECAFVLATVWSGVEKARQVARGLADEPGSGAGQVGLVGEARVDGSQGDRLGRQVEDGRPEAPPHSPLGGRRSGLFVDQGPQPRRG